MAALLDAPWIVETERTGYSSQGYFNHPTRIDDAVTCDRCGIPIYLGDDYYNIDGENLCDECFDTIAREWRRRHGE